MKYAIIQGRGSFPFDMLRYDSCCPNSERDSILLEQSVRNGFVKGIKEIERWSICVKSASDNNWTVGRWESFGVKCVPVPREMTFEHNSYSEVELST
jgi:hypothetical protein